MNRSESSLSASKLESIVRLPVVAVVLWLLPPLGCSGARAQTDEGVRGSRLALEVLEEGRLDHFRKRSLQDADRKLLPLLIRQLGDEDFDVREKAAARLIAIGSPALRELRKARNTTDAEVRRHVDACIKTIDEALNPEVDAPGVWAMEGARPRDGLEVLLNYLPNVEDAVLEARVLQAIAKLGVKDGKLDPLLERAVNDPEQSRRAAAVYVLGRCGTKEQRQVAQRLLTDSDPAIRFRAAEGLIAGRETGATPTLLALLTEGPLDLARQAEDLLTRMAGDRAPALSLGETDEERKKCRAAWEVWWKAHASKLDLTRFDADLISTAVDYQARDVARAFYSAWCRGDGKAIADTFAVPFCPLTRTLGADGAVQTKQEFISQMPDRGTGVNSKAKVSFRVVRMISFDEYFKRTDRELVTGSFFDPDMRPRRLVYMEADVDGVTRDVVLMIRLIRKKAYVVGNGLVKDSK
jgi:HEAT repeat protein